jgi:cytidine deaminase
LIEHSNKELIALAASVVKAQRVNEYLIGDVGAALVSESNQIHRGVCIEVSSGMGFCAEHSAIASMITAGDLRIRKIVAVHKQNDHVFVLTPCGRCRAFMHAICTDNLETEDILGPDQSATLAELLPYAKWYERA